MTAEKVFYLTFSGLTVILGLSGIAALILSLLKRKEADHHYGGMDVLSYVLDVPLLLVYLRLSVVYLGYGFAGAAEGWKDHLVHAADIAAILALPLSIWSIAASISLRKKARSRDSFLMQFSCIPVHAFCLIVYYLVFGPA